MENITIARERVYGRSPHTNIIVGVAPDTMVVVREDEADYPRLVSALVRSRYSADDMEAIINNHLLDAEASREAFEAMQAWRQEAKAVAREVADRLGKAEKQPNDKHL